MESVDHAVWPSTTLWWRSCTRPLTRLWQYCHQTACWNETSASSCRRHFAALERLRNGGCSVTRVLKRFGLRTSAAGIFHHQDPAGMCGCHGDDVMAEGCDEPLTRRARYAGTRRKRVLVGAAERGTSGGWRSCLGTQATEQRPRRRLQERWRQGAAHEMRWNRWKPSMWRFIGLRWA